jgi:hypothetical protein
MKGVYYSKAAKKYVVYLKNPASPRGTRTIQKYFGGFDTKEEAKEMADRIRANPSSFNWVVRKREWVGVSFHSRFQRWQVYKNINNVHTFFGSFKSRQEAEDRRNQVLTNPHIKEEKMKQIKRKQEEILQRILDEKPTPKNPLDNYNVAPLEESESESDCPHLNMFEERGCTHPNIAPYFPCCMDCGLFIEEEIDSHTQVQQTHYSGWVYPRPASLSVSKVDDLYFLRFGKYLRKFNRKLLNALADVYLNCQGP